MAVADIRVKSEAYPAGATGWLLVRTTDACLSPTSFHFAGEGLVRLVSLGEPVGQPGRPHVPTPRRRRYCWIHPITRKPTIGRHLPTSSLDAGRLVRSCGCDRPTTACVSLASKVGHQS